MFDKIIISNVDDTHTLVEVEDTETGEVTPMYKRPHIARRPLSEIEILTDDPPSWNAPAGLPSMPNT